MLRDVFYFGEKPNVHPRERFAQNIDDARSQCRTSHFWIINEYCDYSVFDWDFDFDFEHNFNINFDSIMKQAQISIQEIDFEAIRQNIEEAIEKMESEMREMEEQRKAKKEEK